MRDDQLYLVPFVAGQDCDVVRWTRDYHCCGVIGRLASGATLDQARAELPGIRRQLAGEYPAYKKEWGLDLGSLQRDLTGDIRRTLLTLLGAVGLVPLIACANVSNLLLARGAAHSRQLAIRTALGASSYRIISQLAVERFLLAGAGCALGLGLAALAIELLPELLAGITPQAIRPELDFNVMAFSALASCGCAVLFGLLPALRAGRQDLNLALKESEPGS